MSLDVMSANDICLVPQVETAVQEVVTPIAGQAAEAIKAISSTDNSKVVAEASAKEELPKEKGQALQEVVESVKASAVQVGCPCQHQSHCKTFAATAIAEQLLAAVCWLSCRTGATA